MFAWSGRVVFPYVMIPPFGSVSHGREECQGEHGEGDVSIPGVVETDLVVVESSLTFRRFEAFFDGPAVADDADQFRDRFSAWVVAVEVGDFAVRGIPPEHVLVTVAGVGQCPVVGSESFRSDPAGTARPVVGFHPGGDMF